MDTGGSTIMPTVPAMGRFRHPARVLIAAFHAYPDPAVGAKRVSELANFLADHGWQVKVVAAEGPSAIGGRQVHSTVERIGVPVPRPIYPRFQGLIPKRWRGSEGANASLAADRFSESARRQAPHTRSHLVETLRTEYFRYTDIIDNRKRWSLGLAMAMLRVTKRWRPDVALVSGPEWSPVAVSTIVCALRHLPLVVDFRDPWLGRGGFTPPIYDGARRMVDSFLEARSVNRARVLTVSSGRLLGELKARYPERSGSIHLIRNGYDPAAWVDPAGPTGRLDLLHAGTVYFNRTPMPLLEGLLRFVGRPGIDRHRVSVTMVGDCARWRGVDLAAWARDHGLDDILRIQPPVPADRVRELTASSTVLVTFAQGQPAQVPAKLFEQIGANREILLYTERDSESADVAGGLPWVTVVDDDPFRSEEFLASAYERHVQMRGSLQIDPACSATFARSSALEAFATLMDNIASRVE